MSDELKLFISLELNTTWEALVGLGRKKGDAQNRHMAVYIVRCVTDLSLKQIGRLFQRDHSTIISSFRKIDNRYTYPGAQEQCDKIVDKIKAMKHGNFFVMYPENATLFGKYKMELV